MEAAQIPNSVPVSVAIPAYRSDETLCRSLRYICDCRPLPQEILIHCDGGWELAAGAFAGLPVPVRLIKSAENVGPGGGRHRLFHEAACEIIASFDDDSWPLDREYFAQALAVMEAFPNAAVMSPAVYLREKPILMPMLEASLVRSFEGSASVNRKSMYAQLPGYVPVPAAYGVEEADLSLQIQAAGWSILSCLWMRAWHDRPYADHGHSVLPWIRNEVLLAYLRFPRIGQPWGWVRAVRHVWRHRHEVGWLELLRQLAYSLPHAIHYQGYVRRYSLLEVWRHHRQKERRFLLTSTSRDGRLVVRLSAAPKARRVLFIQYTNPAGYPPLEHASRMLARSGWEVEFRGIHSNGSDGLEFAPHPRVRVRRIRYQKPGVMQKLHYLGFILWCVWGALRWRPAWVYASDVLSAPAAEIILKLRLARLVYHEHDSPVGCGAQDGSVLRQVRKSRNRLGRDAHLILLPNQKRLDHFLDTTSSRGLAFCVWNCPSLDEIPESAPSRPLEGPLKVLYHGSIVPERFGVFILEALALCQADVRLTLIGYFPLSNMTYRDVLMTEAARLGVSDRFEYLGTIPQRAELMARGSSCHVGLCMLRIHEGDINMQHMSGASNKPFDYASQGLALIIPPDAEWERLYAAVGCSMSCPMGDAEKLADVLCWMAGHRNEVAEMGRRGHAMARAEWHYEKQFASVLEQMEERAGDPITRRRPVPPRSPQMNSQASHLK
ncbi:glycosyltransferase [Brevifollis gellanilyticus]|nr:glycosyltransferase [Brevifollis gellanilyticus]